MLDKPKKIEKKIKSAVTDSEGIVKFDKENKPGVSSLLTIFASCSGESIESSEKKYAQSGYGELKQDVANAVIQTLEPLQEKYDGLNEPDGLDSILHKGRQNASVVADCTLAKAKNAVGLGRFY